MSVAHDVVAELVGMFVDDLRLAGTTAAVVVAAVVSRYLLGWPAAITGAILVVGIAGALTGSILRARGRG